MDRNGKKTKASPKSPQSERSDLKSKSRGVVDQIAQDARAGADPRAAKASGSLAKSARGSR